MQCAVDKDKVINVGMNSMAMIAGIGGAVGLAAGGAAAFFGAPLIVIPAAVWGVWCVG